MSNPLLDDEVDICTRCGQAKTSVMERVDPFLRDVHNEVSVVTICSECYQDLKDSV